LIVRPHTRGAAAGGGDGGVRKSRGLTLGKKGGGAADALLRKIAQEDAIDVSAQAASAPAAAAAAAAPAGGARAVVSVNVEEKISAQLPRDGGVQSLEIRGDLVLLVSAAVPDLRINLRAGDNAAFSFKARAVCVVAVRRC
jgi:hypothetical protein